MNPVEKEWLKYKTEILGALDEAKELGKVPADILDLMKLMLDKSRVKEKKEEIEES